LTGLPREILKLPLFLLLPLVSPSVDLSLSTLSKSNTGEIFQSTFLEICERLQVYYHIYTDGSKMNNLTAAAAVGQDV